MLFIYSLRQLATFFAVVFTDTYEGLSVNLLFFLAMAAIPLCVSVLLWVFPTIIAKKVVPPETDVLLVPEKTFSILVALILTVGLYTFFYAAVDAIYWLTYSHLLSSNTEPQDLISSTVQSDKANMLATSFELITSLFIILRAKYIANFLYRVAR